LALAGAVAAFALVVDRESTDGAPEEARAVVEPDPLALPSRGSRASTATPSAAPDPAAPAPAAAAAAPASAEPGRERASAEASAESNEHPALSGAIPASASTVIPPPTAAADAAPAPRVKSGQTERPHSGTARVRRRPAAVNTDSEADSFDVYDRRLAARLRSRGLNLKDLHLLDAAVARTWDSWRDYGARDTSQVEAIIRAAGELSANDAIIHAKAQRIAETIDALDKSTHGVPTKLRRRWQALSKLTDAPPAMRLDVAIALTDLESGLDEALDAEGSD
jgi:hypothetical protein